MSARDTSLEAYDDLKTSGRLSAQEQRVLDWIRARAVGMDFSLRELCRGTGLEINAVSGRCSDLKDAGMLEEGPARRCTISGRTVHPVRLPPKQGVLL